jgi:thiol-disulfide isomerase/thioredoxin
VTSSRRALLAAGARLCAGAGVGVGVGLVVGACAAAPPKPVSIPAHPLQGLTDFDGVALSSVPPILGRTATLVDFWASWCAPCRMAFPHLDQLYRTWAGRGLDVIGISVDDDPRAARRFAAGFRPHFPLAWDANADVRERFAVSSLPTQVLLDGQGLIVARNVGFDLADHRAVEEQVRRLADG